MVENKPKKPCVIAWLLIWFMVPEQEEMVQFGLFLLYSKVETDPQTCPLIYLISMATFYFNILYAYIKEI